MTGPSRKKASSNCHSWIAHSIIEQCRLEGISAGYLVPSLAQTMANFKVRLGCLGVLQWSFENLHEWRIHLLAATLMIFFFLMFNQNFTC